MAIASYSILTITNYLRKPHFMKSLTTPFNRLTYKSLVFSAQNAVRSMSSSTLGASAAATVTTGNANTDIANPNGSF